MPTIRLSNKVKQDLDKQMQKEILEEIQNPRSLIKALKNKYGYTHSEFIAKLLRERK